MDQNAQNQQTQISQSPTFADPASAPSASVPAEPTVPPQTTSPSQPVEPPAESAEQETYVENMAGSLADILDEIGASEELSKQVAHEMNVDVPKLRESLNSLISKIDSGQLTKEELALLITAPTMGEPSSK